MDSCAFIASARAKGDEKMAAPQRASPSRLRKNLARQEDGPESIAVWVIPAAGLIFTNGWGHGGRGGGRGNRLRGSDGVGGLRLLGTGQQKRKALLRGNDVRTEGGGRSSPCDREPTWTCRGGSACSGKNHVEFAGRFGYDRTGLCAALLKPIEKTPETLRRSAGSGQEAPPTSRGNSACGLAQGLAALGHDLSCGLPSIVYGLHDQTDDGGGRRVPANAGDSGASWRRRRASLSATPIHDILTVSALWCSSPLGFCFSGGRGRSVRVGRDPYATRVIGMTSSVRATVRTAKAARNRSTAASTSPFAQARVTGMLSTA